MDQLLQKCTSGPVRLCLQMDVPYLRCSAPRTRNTFQEKSILARSVESNHQSGIGYDKKLDLFGHLRCHLSE